MTSEGVLISWAVGIQIAGLKTLLHQNNVVFLALCLTMYVLLTFHVIYKQQQRKHLKLHLEKHLALCFQIFGFLNMFNYF